MNDYISTRMREFWKEHGVSPEVIDRFYAETATEDDMRAAEAAMKRIKPLMDDKMAGVAALEAHGVYPSPGCVLILLGGYYSELQFCLDFGLVYQGLNNEGRRRFKGEAKERLCSGKGTL